MENLELTIEEITQAHFNAIKVVKIKGKTSVYLAVHGKNNHNRLVNTKDNGETFKLIKSDAVLTFEKFVKSCK